MSPVLNPEIHLALVLKHSSFLFEPVDKKSPTICYQRVSEPFLLGTVSEPFLLGTTLLFLYLVFLEGFWKSLIDKI